MTISAANLLVMYSTKVGVAGNTQPGTPAGSLGKYLSTTVIPDADLHNLFDIISGDENAASESEVRCFFLRNITTTDTFLNPKLYLSGDDPAGASIQIGLDPTGIKTQGSAAVQAVEVANENGVPAGVVFSAPVDAASALALPSIPPESCVAIWIKRTASNSPALPGDYVSLALIGETL